MDLRGMTTVGKMEGLDGADYDSLESVLDEIPDLVTWMNNNYDVEHQELLWMSDVVGGGSSGVYDDTGVYSFPTGNEYLTQFGGYASSDGSVVGGGGSDYGVIIGGPENGVRSQVLVGGGDWSSESMSVPGLYDGRNNMNGFLSDEEELCRYLSRMGVRDDGVEYASEVKFKDVDLIGFPFPDDPCMLNDRGDIRKVCSGYGVAAAVAESGYLSCGGVGGGRMMMSPALPGFQKGHFSDNLFQHQMYPRGSGTSFPPMGYSTLPVGRQNVGEQAPYTYHQEVSRPNFSATFNGLSMPDTLYCVPRSRMNSNGGDGILDAPNLHQRPMLNISSERQYGLQSNRSPVPRMPQGGLQDINGEGSFILQGHGMCPVSNKNVDFLRRPLKGSFSGSGVTMPKGKHNVRTSKISGTHERRQNQHMCSPGVIPHKYGSLSKVHGHLNDVAKHQTHCRLLQDIIEQRNPQAIQAIFDEIIEHVVELMINPFGNYFMQKLLDVCSEEQRTKIIDVVAEEPGELVRLSTNDHGTRVIQKLIETAKTREQILKIISALESGFYALITDSNGHHVIERCLHCYTNEENQFIFLAVIEYCIEIATDQYGCCVLQKCIGHSIGEYRDRLVAEISNNAFLLSQDAFGNYAVQFILDMKNPLYTSRLISQFQGKYVHLAMQKCSSHVVEKCLRVFNSHNKSQLIYELVSFSHFEQLLQDPHANYVIQTALKVSEGAVHQRLIQKIELYRAISRHSPYSKRIFSSKRKK